jgi:formate dehydrogenase subunit gamma
MMIVLWIRQNIPDRHDLTWLAKGGGILVKGVHVSAKKFNAGQKIMFWLAVLSGISISVTGLMLMFPFIFEPFGPTFAALNIFGFSLPTDLSAMQEMLLTQLWHALLGVLMVALIIAHIYIGSLGMEGTFEAMWTGTVDENWARAHHSLWLEDLDAEGKTEPEATGTAPAE